MLHSEKNAMLLLMFFSNMEHEACPSALRGELLHHSVKALFRELLLVPHYCFLDKGLVSTSPSNYKKNLQPQM